MKKYEYPEVGEVLYKERLSNGLTVMVLPRPGFSRRLAYFVTDYGAIHTDFTLDGKTIHSPAGVAHFLEHKMFDLPGGRDVSAELAALGANTNAFTSYDMTAYYISCTENFEQALRLLIEFVSTPYFTEESVAKEMGIIDQEIGMNEDTPDTQVFEGLMERMFENHPIRVPILGTSETIRQITPQTLYDCHRAFYTPGNMILCVVGDVDPDDVARIALEMLGGSERSVGQKQGPWEETMQTDAKYCREMEVAMPMFHIAFKAEPTGKGEEAVRREIVADLAAEALFGESSQLYMDLYERGLIDSSFGGGFETIDGMAMLLLSGDSEDPEAVRETVLQRVRDLCREGIAEADFLRMKRSAFGRRIRDLDSFSSTCFRLCAYHMTDFDYFEFPRIYETVDAAQVLEFLDRVVRPERCGISVIRPQKEES